jgi:glycosyltransferase involved in cell wall biosynthesis
MTAKVVILVPVLRRPHRAAPLVESIRAATPEPHRVLFVGSPDDTEELEACRATGADLLTLPGSRAPGDWARKINLGYRCSTEPLMLLAGDDLVFHPGWLPAVLRAAATGVGVVGTNDLANPRVTRGDHSTHPVVCRWYADEHGTVDGPGRVVAECYDHNFVDDELVATARSRSEWAFAPTAHVEHRHPTWATAEDDEVYRLGRAGFRRDRDLFYERVRQFGLPRAPR